MPAVPAGALGPGPTAESSAQIRRRIVAARARQAERFTGTAVRANSALQGRALRRWCQPDADGLRLLDKAVQRLALSAHGYDRVRKVARTIADLSGADRIDATHLAEALQYRMVE